MVGEGPRQDGGAGVGNDDLEAGGEAGGERDGKREDGEAAEAGGGGEGEEALTVFEGALRFGERAERRGGEDEEIESGEVGLPELACGGAAIVGGLDLAGGERGGALEALLDEWIVAVVKAIEPGAVNLPGFVGDDGVVGVEGRGESGEEGISRGGVGGGSESGGGVAEGE